MTTRNIDGDTGLTILFFHADFPVFCTVRSSEVHGNEQFEFTYERFWKTG
jgi:hypothetical protein